MKLSRPRAKKNSKKTPPQPVTADEFLEAGTSEEDSGDRWISSGDVPKGVRFYQRAFAYYSTAVEKCTDSEAAIRDDALYNMCRIQFVVYTKVVKPAGVLDELMGNIEEDQRVIEHSVESIGSNHEQAIVQAGGEDKCQIDLLYNYAQVLAEAGEEKEDEQYYVRAAAVLDKVLDRQSQQLNAMPVAKQATVDDEINKDGEQEVKNEDEAEEDVYSNFGPEAVLETLTTYIQYLTSLLEITSFRSDTVDKTAQLVGQLESLASAYELPVAALDEARIAVAQNHTLQLLDNMSLDSIEQVWLQSWVPTTASRYMAEADAYIDFATNRAAANDAWAALTRAGKVLQTGLSAAGAADMKLKLKLWIAKGDVEWLRSGLDTESAIKFRETLRKNAAVYYTNAMNTQGLQLLADVGGEAARLKREAKVKKALVSGAALEPADEPLAKQVLGDFN